MARFFLFCALLISGSFFGQGYDIKVNFKGCKDTMVYLVKYTFDQQFVVDTSKDVKNGQIQFKGKKDLERGVYTLVSEAKSIYFDLFINDSQKFTITTDAADQIANLKVVGSKENEQFFNYIKYITAKNKEFNKAREQAKNQSKEDSAKFVAAQVKALNEDVKKYEADFLVKVKGTFLYDVMNLKMEKEPKNVPLASNGRPDSVYQYYYYKNHFFDEVDFKDERIIRTPFFDDRVKRYFEHVIVQHPDTMIAEIDKIIAKCTEGGLVYNLLIAYFSSTSEQSKIMGYDKVFVHVADKYVISGRAKGVYAEETVKKIKDRVDIMRHLLMDAKVSDINMIDTTNGKLVRKMGFDTASTSKSITDLYYKNVDKLTPMFKTLYGVNAKYTILVFWAVDCGHCQSEMPKLHEELQALKGKVDFKVFAVQTKDDLFDTWRKFLIEKKLTDFIHVYDPIHLNNLKEQFDIYSTPVIYILDKDKKIKAKRLAAEQVTDMIKAFEQIEENQKTKQNKN